MSEIVWLTVEVTEEDIRQGCRGNGRQCPIAQSLRRTGDTYAWLYVGPREIDCGKGCFRTPPEATEFIDDFDKGFHVEPFTFKAARLD